MSLDNKRNILFFKADSMTKLFGEMDEWQSKNRKRFLSMSIEREGDSLCCIALTNPSEVTIVDNFGNNIFRGMPTNRLGAGIVPVVVL